MHSEPDIRLIHKFDTLTPWATLRDGVGWEQRSVRVFGKIRDQPRLTCWYGSVPYRYSGLEWDPEPLPTWLADLMEHVSEAAGHAFNSVLCNLYRDGQDTVGWHADDEPLFGPDPIIASLSYGATRTFQLRPRDGTPKHLEHTDPHDLQRGRSFQLRARDLLIMGRGVQTRFQHRVPRTSEVVGPRINLTFRATV